MRIESGGAGEGKNDLKTLVLENIQLTRELSGSVKKIKRYMFWLQLTSWLKFLILAVPIVLAAIYLPSIISNLQKNYGQLLGGGNGGSVNVNDLLKSPEVQEILKNAQK